MKDLIKSKTGKAILGVLVALGFLAGTLLELGESPEVIENPVAIEVIAE